VPEIILTTKLYVPQPQPNAVIRPRLIERLNQGLLRKLTLVSAPAGFGKTTAVSEWIAGCERPVAWLSLDEMDSNPNRFVAYLVAALQTIDANIGLGMQGALQSPQPPPIGTLLTALLNDIATITAEFVLVLDDLHAIDATSIDDALGFLIEHMPPGMHVVITTREDPNLPLARLRVRGQLTELRATELRFSASEAAEFLNRVMGLNLSEEDIAALETRTEGWIAGLQLAAISMQGNADTSSFITSFTGSHRFVLDYLVEEVLHQQPERVQTFLLRTSILDRLCGPLCDAVVPDLSISGQQTLEYLEHINLFLVPLDNERRWYRYHHLFAELLRQRLLQSTSTFDGALPTSVDELHVRASEWFEAHGLELEAFHHATAAGDVERAERLIEGTGMPLYLRGGVAQVVNWLESLPTTVLDAKPSLWVMFASALSIAGQLSRVEPKLLAAEAALHNCAPDDPTRNLIGRIAGTRSLLALLSGDPSQMDSVVAQSHRALEYLHPDNLRERAGTIWRMGLAYQYQGNRAAARLAHSEAVAASERSGNIHVNILATTGIGKLQETDNQLVQAAGTYRHVLEMVGEPPWGVACEAHVGLARIYYEWNDLDAAEQHGQLSVNLARQVELASFVSSELFLARLQLARGDVTDAIALLAQTEQSVRQRRFWFRMPEIVAAQVRALLQQGNLVEAAHLAQTHELPLSQARVHLAQHDARAALDALEPWRQVVDSKGWDDDRLNVMALQSVAYHANGDVDAAMHLLADALALAEPGGFIRLFVDEGAPMADLLFEAVARGIRPDYARRLLAAFEPKQQTDRGGTSLPPVRTTQPLFEPLSQREMEVLRLIAQGFSNREICDRLFLALNTVKGHNRVIFGKLQVQRRTEAVARARELDLI
jgi:LuxR family transcriptional regulator, maltose regulon positive regulatory protein